MKGQHPWQQLPCAWSAHQIVEGGAVEQLSFVAQNGGDPRGMPLESLIESARATDMLVTSQPEFEQRLRTTMDEDGAYKQSVRTILNHTWLDLATSRCQRRCHRTMSKRGSEDC